MCYFSFVWFVAVLLRLGLLIGVSHPELVPLEHPLVPATLVHKFLFLVTPALTVATSPPCPARFHISFYTWAWLRHRKFWPVNFLFPLPLAFLPDVAPSLPLVTGPFSFCDPTFIEPRCDLRLLNSKHVRVLAIHLPRQFKVFFSFLSGFPPVQSSCGPFLGPRGRHLSTSQSPPLPLSGSVPTSLE